jgi:hypothetical protein
MTEQLDQDHSFCTNLPMHHQYVGLMLHDIFLNTVRLWSIAIGSILCPTAPLRHGYNLQGGSVEGNKDTSHRIGPCIPRAQK